MSAHAKDCKNPGRCEVCPGGSFLNDSLTGDGAVFSENLLVGGSVFDENPAVGWINFQWEFDSQMGQFLMKI